MAPQFVRVATFALALTGCGGGSNHPGVGEATGVFQAGGVQGVRFQTPTRSGETDSQGRFRYLPGESVTFSTGGLTLGSADGAPVVTPFTLSGVTAPSTELDLRRELERAARLATPFGRAVNIERLLLALDADHDPSNGIVIAARGTLVAGDIDLGMSVPAFSATLRKRIADLTDNLPDSEPVVFLFRAVGISVPSHLEMRADTTFAPRLGFSPVAESTTYGSSGARESSSLDYDGDGRADVENSWRYDALGRVISLSATFIDVAGVAPATRLSTFDYDAQGRSLGGTELQSGSPQGVPQSRLRRVRQNDESGFPSMEVVETDLGADGAVDSRRTSSYRFDSRHNLTAQVSETEFTAASGGGMREVAESHYDASDRPILSRRQIDHGADGIIDSSSLDAYEYDATGPGGSRQVSEQDSNGDGAIDARTVSTSMRDSEGALTSLLNEYDATADGHIDARTAVSFTYDESHHVVLEESRFDQDGDGAFEQINRVTRTLDGNGNPMEVVAEDDVTGAARATRQKFSYGPNGERLGLTIATRAAGQPEFEPSSNTTIAQRVVMDGVPALAQLFLDDLAPLPGSVLPAIRSGAPR